MRIIAYALMAVLLVTLFAIIVIIARGLIKIYDLMTEAKINVCKLLLKYTVVEEDFLNGNGE